MFHRRNIRYTGLRRSMASGSRSSPVSSSAATDARRSSSAFYRHRLPTSSVTPSLRTIRGDNAAVTPARLVVAIERVKHCSCSSIACRFVRDVPVKVQFTEQHGVVNGNALLYDIACRRRQTVHGRRLSSSRTQNNNLIFRS